MRTSLAIKRQYFNHFWFHKGYRCKLDICLFKSKVTWQRYPGAAMKILNLIRRSNILRQNFISISPFQGHARSIPPPQKKWPGRFHLFKMLYEKKTHKHPDTQINIWLSIELFLIFIQWTICKYKSFLFSLFQLSYKPQN